MRMLSHYYKSEKNPKLKNPVWGKVFYMVALTPLPISYVSPFLPFCELWKPFIIPFVQWNLYNVTVLHCNLSYSASIILSLQMKDRKNQFI